MFSIWIINILLQEVSDMVHNEFFRVVCIDEGNPFEYRVLEDVNRGTLEEVCDFLKENYSKYSSVHGVKWLLLKGNIATY